MTKRRQGKLTPSVKRPCWKCSYCGNLVVRLPITGPLFDKRKSMVVYVKGWDGHPWYVPAQRILEGKWVQGNAVVHPSHKKKFKPRNPVEGYDADEYRKRREEEKHDPFFSLEIESVPESVPSEPSTLPTGAYPLSRED